MITCSVFLSSSLLFCVPRNVRTFRSYIVLVRQDMHVSKCIRSNSTTHYSTLLFATLYHSCTEIEMENGGKKIKCHMANFCFG